MSLPRHGGHPRQLRGRLRALTTIAAAAAMFLWAGAGVAAAVTTPVWENLTPPTTTSSASLESVAGIGGYAVAVGQEAAGSTPNSGRPLALGYDGSQWRRLPLPGVTWHGVLTSVTAPNPDSVWTVGTDSDGQTHILRFNGRSLRETPYPGQADPVHGVTKIDAPPGGSPWALGYYTLVRWNGTAWESVPIPHPLTAIRVVGPNDVWVSGQGEATFDGQTAPAAVVSHWDGASWTTLPYVETYSRVDDIHVVSPTNVWVVGQNTPLRRPPSSVGLSAQWDGTRWAKTMAPDGTGGCYEVVGSPDGSSVTESCGGRLLRTDGTTWTRSVLPPPPPDTLAVAEHLAYLPGTGVTLAVGSGSIITTTPSTFIPVLYRTSD